MESDEIEILMPVLTNLAIFLQVTGVNPGKSKQLVNSISTHSRLGICSDFITSICEVSLRVEITLDILCTGEMEVG